MNDNIRALYLTNDDDRRQSDKVRRRGVSVTDIGLSPGMRPCGPGLCKICF